MGGDLIALIVAVVLGVVVVVVGSRRELGGTTREWLPQPEGSGGPGSEPPGPRFGTGWRRPRSPRQRRLMIGLYLLFGIGQATLAVGSDGFGWINALLAVGFFAIALLTWRQRPLSSAEDSTF